MPKSEVKVIQYSCSRCKHKWIPRSNKKEEPIVCPKCKSPYWNKEKKS